MGRTAAGRSGSAVASASAASEVALGAAQAPCSHDAARKRGRAPPDPVRCPSPRAAAAAAGTRALPTGSAPDIHPTCHPASSVRGRGRLERACGRVTVKNAVKYEAHVRSRLQTRRAGAARENVPRRCPHAANGERRRGAHLQTRREVNDGCEALRRLRVRTARKIHQTYYFRYCSLSILRKNTSRAPQCHNSDKGHCDAETNEPGPMRFGGGYCTRLTLPRRRLRV